MKMYQDLATLFLKFALATDFISVDGSRLGIWGKGTAAFLLATMPRYRWSIDETLTQNK
jgi:hypothetical protein